MASAIICQLPTARPVFNPRLDTVGFVVDKVAMVQISLSTSISPANSHST
jgi:hypothetical protein